jgi:uncharacterized protein (DUF1501 family)
MTNEYRPAAISRRQMLARCSTGFGAMALAGLMGPAVALPHYQPRAKHVIFCYMSGGVSHIDSFDPKPRLNAEHGKPMPVKVERTQFNQNGNIFGSPFSFQRYGESGLEVSSLFPHIGACADDLAVIRSMTSKVSEHAQGNYFFHTGFPFMGHPSAGAWINYGLGSDADNLPGFVVLQSGNCAVPHGGVGLYSSGYLPAQTQGSILQGDQPSAVRNIQPLELAQNQRARLDLVRDLDHNFIEILHGQQDVEAAVANYETAFRMQAAVPELCDLSGETEATKAMYGLDHPNISTAAYARQCLLARRLVEQGVRFVELSCLPQNPQDPQRANPWDQHGNLEEGHGSMALQVDQPIGALLKDLKARGLLDETLVVWAGEFGRTPFSQGSNGRDHNPYGFSVWMAGGGVKGGTVHGATDEYGYHVVENPCTVYDLWATVLHLLGLDHTRLTYRNGGRDFRLTDVHGNLIQPIIA